MACIISSPSIFIDCFPYIINLIDDSLNFSINYAACLTLKSTN